VRNIFNMERLHDVALSDIKNASGGSQ